jgi:hypothetical protein
MDECDRRMDKEVEIVYWNAAYHLPNGRQKIR